MSAVDALVTIEGVQSRQHSGFRFDLTGGHLALDLANTVSRRDNPERRKEHLASYADVLSFAVQDGIVSARQATELRGYAQNHQAEAGRSFRKAVVLRETLYRLFAALAQKKTPQTQDLRTVNDYAVEALHHRRLARSNGNYRWEWKTEGKNVLDRVLWPIAQSAAELLTGDELKLVRWCEAPDCQWLFLDHSRNRSRRWCDMTSCGNRAKARRHYQRTRA